MKLKLKAKPRLVKFKTGKFNKSANNDASFSNVPKVEKDNTTIEQTVNKYVNKKQKSSLGLKVYKFRKPRIVKVQPTLGDPNLGRTSGGTPYGEEGGGGGPG